ncbi:MAG: class D beta-lactamase [Bacteroidia bacterium]|nr:class D beta-lactamase [Bacteroidia bacterium]
MRLINYLLFALFALITLHGSAQQITRIVNFEKYFGAFKVEGCFVLYDLEKDQLTISNPERCKTGFLPASTFKIFNSLVALETGVASGKDFLIKWDGKDYGSAGWNRDHTLESAFKASAVWYYQEIARRIGEEKMQLWLNRAEYGNKNLGGGIDMFWLKGALRITPIEQALFMARLVKETLPFSRANQQLVKAIMLEKEPDGYRFGAKTGWAILADKTNIGWLVGYILKDGKWYTFATNIESKTELTDFQQIRRDITLQILGQIGLDK